MGENWLFVPFFRLLHNLPEGPNNTCEIQKCFKCRERAILLKDPRIQPPVSVFVNIAMATFVKVLMWIELNLFTRVFSLCGPVCGHLLVGSLSRTLSWTLLQKMWGWMALRLLSDNMAVVGQRAGAAALSHDVLHSASV